MAATYSHERLLDRDKVRALLSDTDVTPATDALFSDEEIAAVLADTGTVALTVAQLAGELVVRFARKPVSIKAGDVQVDYSSRIPAWRDLAASAGGGGSVTFVPGYFGAAEETDEYSRFWR